MRKFINSFRTRIIYLFIQSLLIAAVVTFAIYKSLQYYYHHHVFYGDTYMKYRFWMREVGDIYVFLALYIPFAILVFYLLTRTYTKYFNEISTGIRQLAAGDFSHQIEISSKDEFRQIANDLNEASSGLRTAIQAETLAQRSKETLIANLAHDLRTPLTSVTGYLDLLNQPSITAEQRIAYTKIAYKKSRDLEELMETLFDISKLDLSLKATEQSMVDLHELLLQLLDEMYPMISRVDGRIDQQIAPNLTVYGNGKELARVFENLLSNALRYGDVSRPIEVKATLQAESILIHITNYGPPIRKEDVPHLFDMFYTVDQVRNMPTKQTGLGLFIAKTIVEKHAGTIEIKQPDGQIRFEVTLPSDLRNL